MIPTRLPVLRSASPGREKGAVLPTPARGWRRVLETTSYALILLGFGCLLLVDRVSSGVLLAAALLLIPGGILSRQPNSLLYSRAWNLATLLFMAASLILARWNESAAIQTLAHLCIFLQIHKAFNYRTPRDYFQIWTLSLMMFLLVPLSQRTPPLLFGILLLGFLGASVWHFGALGWRADTRPEKTPASRQPGAEGGSDDPAEPGAFEGPGGRPAPVLARAWRRLALAGLLLTLLGFFCLPRPVLPPALRQAESAEDARARQSLVTGFAQSIDLRQISSLRLDPTEALRLSGGPLVRMAGVRLRAGTLDWFDGNRWEHTTNFGGGLRLPRHANPPEFRATGAEWSPAKVQSLQRITVDARRLPFRGLLTLPGTVGIGGIPGEVMMNDDGSLTTWPGSPKRYVLFARQDPAGSEGALSAFGTEGDASERYLHLHERFDPDWLKSLAERVVAGAATNLEKARRLETYLKRQGEYTLDLRRLAGGDGAAVIQRFLSAPRPQGHCELFATGMAILCRSLGLPSRIVTGFSGGVYDGEAEELVMRHADAHAWVEVWIPDRGWMTFDPTPAAPLVSFSDRLPFFQIRQWTAGILEAWQRLAGEYGNRNQRRALAWLGDRMDRLLTGLTPGGSDQRVFARVREGFRDPAVRWVAAGLLALNVAVLALWRRRRRIATWLRPTGKTPSAAGDPFWGALREALLEASGARDTLPPSGVTFAEFLAAQAKHNGADWESIGRALVLYESRRFGSRVWTVEDERQFRGRLTSLRA